MIDFKVPFFFCDLSSMVGDFLLAGLTALEAGGGLAMGCLASSRGGPYLSTYLSGIGL